LLVDKSNYLISKKGVQSDNFKEPFAHSNFYPGSVALALFSGLFSYDGWDILNYGAEDVKKPRRFFSKWIY